MKRRPQDTKAPNWRPQRVDEIRDAREKVSAERQRILERYKGQRLAAEHEREARAAALALKRNRFASLSVDDALAAAGRLAFVDLEAARMEAAFRLNRPSLFLIEQFANTLKDRSSLAILQW